MPDVYLGRGWGSLSAGEITATSAAVSTLRRAFALPDARSKPRKHKKKSLSEEKLLELGRKHFAEDFPKSKASGLSFEGPIEVAG
jgi:hypothetical protein